MGVSAAQVFDCEFASSPDEVSRRKRAFVQGNDELLRAREAAREKEQAEKRYAWRGVPYLSSGDWLTELAPSRRVGSNSSVSSCECVLVGGSCECVLVGGPVQGGGGGRAQLVSSVCGTG